MDWLDSMTQILNNRVQSRRLYRVFPAHELRLDIANLATSAIVAAEKHFTDDEARAVLNWFLAYQI